MSDKMSENFEVWATQRGLSIIKGHPSTPFANEYLNEQTYLAWLAYKQAPFNELINMLLDNELRQEILRILNTSTVRGSKCDAIIGAIINQIKNRQGQ